MPFLDRGHLLGVYARVLLQDRESGLETALGTRHVAHGLLHERLGFLGMLGDLALAVHIEGEADVARLGESLGHDPGVPLAEPGPARQHRDR